MTGCSTPKRAQSLVCRVMAILRFSPGWRTPSAIGTVTRGHLSRRRRSEDRVAAADQEAVAGVEAGRVRRQEDGHPAEALRLAPAANGGALDHLVIELVAALPAGGHAGPHPTPDNRFD